MCRYIYICVYTYIFYIYIDDPKRENAKHTRRNTAGTCFCRHATVVQSQFHIWIHAVISKDLDDRMPQRNG